MTLQDIVKAAVDRAISEQISKTIAETIADMGNEVVIDRRVADANKAYRAQRASAIPSEPIQRTRRRGPSRPSVVYVVTDKRRKVTDDMLFHTARVTFRAIERARKALSARELETVTKQPRKTVESTIWYLRNHDAAGQRLTPKQIAAGKALILSQPAE